MKKYQNILQCESNFREMTNSISKVDENVHYLHTELQQINTDYLEEIGQNLVAV